MTLFYNNYYVIGLLRLIDLCPFIQVLGSLKAGKRAHEAAALAVSMLEVYNLFCFTIGGGFIAI